MQTPDLHAGSLTEVAGLSVGHFTDTRRPTGCSVVLCPEGAVAGVDVRGAAPGTRETDLLTPGNLVERVHAIVLTGGSAWGLDAAGGVMHWLDAHGHGLSVGAGARVPIVPAAVLFDLHVGDARIRPDAQAGFAACENAGLRVAQGCVGAAAGASVGKLWGMARAMRGGIGTASVSVAGVTVGALIAVNAVGDVRDPVDNRLLAGARSADGRRLHDTAASLLAGEVPQAVLPGTNTTIGVVATDMVLDKAQAKRLAMSAHDGLARTINPVHTQTDGDTLFALATGRSAARVHPTVLGLMASEAVARAVANAVRAAHGLRLGELHLPAHSEL
ncbi:peptidase S58 [Comamonas serinivorans]|uniref:Peptidase S58 n=1 Tax=Comamonas serinivorans TaxID=1082851 RepID=A0A1Y0ETK4_9BURK|nr:P1 family peptidase [Comamonas serinivorans]ARU06639.1 peptidase S58 [Comamonas serinivorans]